MPLALLQAIAEVPEEPLRRGLTHLQAAEFLYETRLFPEIEYTFKHALTHEVAYETLLQERRRALHARIVEALEALAGGPVAEQVERLAHHALRGEVWDKALAYCRQAGEKALARSAYREAVGSFEQALSALPHLPEQRDTREQAIDLRLALRSALHPSGDFGRILAYLREAETLAAALDDPRRLGQVSLFLSLHFYLMGAYDQAIAAAQRALALATASGEVGLHALANLPRRRLPGPGRLSSGDRLPQADRGVPRGARRHERFGQVVLPAVLSRACLAWCHAELGTFAEGRALGEEGLRIAEAVDHPGSLMLASWGDRSAGPPPRRPAQGAPPARTGRGHLSGRGPPGLFPLDGCGLGCGVHPGWACRRRRAAAHAGDGTDHCNGNGSLSGALSSLPGEAQLLAGRLEEAHALAERTLALAHEHQERGHQAYALRLLGDIAARRDPPELDQAEAHYRQALALAEELGMRPLQAHCHLGLGPPASPSQDLDRLAPIVVNLFFVFIASTAEGGTCWLPGPGTALAQCCMDTSGASWGHGLACGQSGAGHRLEGLRLPSRCA